MSETRAVSNLPWQPESELLGNLAIGNLRENMLRRLRTERGVHVETLMTAIGALAGFAAQNAALVEGAEATLREGVVPKDGIVLYGTDAGDRFIFGEWPNRHLFNEAGSHLPLFALVAGAALNVGLETADLPDCSEIAGHVARTIGSEKFGQLRAPEDHTPGMQPIKFLEVGWLWLEELLRLPLPDAMKQANEPPLKEIWWPIIIAMVAGQFIRMTKDALPPKLSASLAMEAAVITSKVDPEKIVPGRWLLKTASGQLAVKRAKE